jgi:hypothetical protein
MQPLAVKARVKVAEFCTERLPLAIGIHATRRLTFLRCERIGPEHVEFVFADPQSKGTDVELEFDSGRLMVAASEIFASQKYMRRRMSEALENRRTRNGYAR